MKNIGIIGKDSLIKWHVQVFFHRQNGFKLNKLAKNNLLSDFIEQNDAIIYFLQSRLTDKNNSSDAAGIEDLNSAFSKVNRKSQIIVCLSKNPDSQVSKSIKNLARNRKIKLTQLVLPEVFGECGRPFNDSIVSTLCYEIANEQKPRKTNNNRIELIYGQDAAREIYGLIKKPKLGKLKLKGTFESVSSLLKKIHDFSKKYRQHIIPDISNNFNLQLFNTYRTFLYPKHYPVKFLVHKADKGSLFEAVKSTDKGQTNMVTTKPGISRGDHYHTTKFERFIVLIGEALICIRKLFSDELVTFETDGSDPQYIDIPTLHTHKITNIGRDDLVTLVWVNKFFDPKHPDIFPEIV